MKNFLILLLLFSSVATFGQMRKISQKIQEMNTLRKPFSEYDLFTKNEDTQKTAKYLSSATDVTVLNLNMQELNRIVAESPDYINLKIPFQDEMIDVQLYKQNVLTDDFHVEDQDGNPQTYQPGAYYRGIINGDYQSLVSISIFDDNVMGIISSLNQGNVVLGKSVDKQDFITYSDSNLLGEFSFHCAADDLEMNQQIQQQINFNPNAKHQNETENCVRLYYEIAHQPYVANGADIDATIDWITGIQNNIGTLYDNDGINMALGSVRIWVIEDPYTGNYSQNLSLFASSVQDFDGDLAHLINYPATTSVAYLDSLCEDYRYAYSGVNLEYEEVPVYSWTVLAMSHEMGHSLGSPHTHACAWNGDNTAIDSCGPLAGYSEGCDDADLPGQEGGTIMSYCHLIGGVGTNLALGFGPQPAQLMRDIVDAKPCLSTECTTETEICTYTIEFMSYEINENGDIEVTLVDETSNEWAAALVPHGVQPTEDDWNYYTDTNFTIQGATGNQYYELYVVNVCGNGVKGGMIKHLLLTGDFCDGTLFTDTGGSNGNYGNNETIVKTFYPSTEDGKIKLSFNYYQLENNWDYLYIHDGDNTSAPIFNGGMLTGFQSPGPTFVSTHPSGAITVVFESDIYMDFSGWEAIVDCNFLGIEEYGDSNGIAVYPNPVRDELNIVSKNEIIQSYTLTEVSGRQIMKSDLGKNSGQIKIGHLPNGVYILTLKTDKSTVTKKIIKK